MKSAQRCTDNPKTSRTAHLLFSHDAHRIKRCLRHPSSASHTGALPPSSCNASIVIHMLLERSDSTSHSSMLREKLLNEDSVIGFTTRDHYIHLIIIGHYHIQPHSFCDSRGSPLFGIPRLPDHRSSPITLITFLLLTVNMTRARLFTSQPGPNGHILSL